MKRIALHGTHASGEYAEALVDDADFDDLTQFHWIAAKSGTGPIYAIRTYRADGKKHFERMHRRIVGASAGDVVDHLNRRTVDNRRCNLRVGTQRDNMLNREMCEEVRTCRQCGAQFVARGLAGSVKRWHCTDDCKRRRDLARIKERNRTPRLGPS